MEKLEKYSKFGAPVYFAEDASEARPSDDEMIIIYGLPRQKDQCCASAYLHGELIASREIPLHRTERDQLRAVRNREVASVIAELTEVIREKR